MLTRRNTNPGLFISSSVANCRALSQSFSIASLFQSYYLNDHPQMMTSILRKLKQRGDRDSADETTAFTMRNGESILKELIAASNGKYNPFRIFSAQELKIATDNYKERNFITEGNVYILYKGYWRERSISVMKFRNHRCFACEDVYERCINNIVYASQMSHKHILKLTGCCLDAEFPTLVLESVESGALAKRIQNPPDQPHFEPLLLTNRLKIAMDIANAVAYLHVGFPRSIIFRDLKSSNILFTKQNVAKLFDFSLSASIPEGETHIKLEPAGALGYLAPEYMSYSEVNEKCDVYSFGILLLELLTGQKVCDESRCENGEDYHLLHFVKKYMKNNRLKEIVDPIIFEDRSCPEKEKEKEQQLQVFAQLIFECVNESPEDRPTMVDVAKKLRQMYRSCM